MGKLQAENRWQVSPTGILFIIYINNSDLGISNFSKNVDDNETDSATITEDERRSLQQGLSKI